MKKLTTVMIDKMMRSLKIFIASLVFRCLAMAVILSYGAVIYSQMIAQVPVATISMKETITTSKIRFSYLCSSSELNTRKMKDSNP